MNEKDIIAFVCAEEELIAKKTASAQEKILHLGRADWNEAVIFKTTSYAPRSKFPPSLIQRCLSGTLRNTNRSKHELGFAVGHHILPSEHE